MFLEMRASFADGYSSNSQRARRISEAWASENLFCAACESTSVHPEPCNTKAADFSCRSCAARYQLKASRSWNERRIPDAGYFAMIEAIRTDRTPNLLVMQYSPTWHVRNLLLIPSFFFSESAVQRRPPLGPNARRAGWVGCNILLSEIAAAGKIPLVVNGEARALSAVRSQYNAIIPLARLKPTLRGWTLEVLRAVESLRSEVFNLAEVYRLETHFESMHPGNRHVRAKIRQQLQVLRDLGLLRFVGRGNYALINHVE